MKHNIYCPVCRITFVSGENMEKGRLVVCLICGARLEVTEVSPEITTRRFPQEPETEIRDRIATYAQLKGYVFSEDKELVLEGLLQKHRQYGDFYCPCRFDNVPENICPCLDTRKGEVRREGKCL